MARGRPRKIDPSDALHDVMIAFWQNGYAATSMTDLSEASGMAKPGLYAAFGDKEALFEKALMHYFHAYGGPIFEKLGPGGGHVVDDLRAFFGAVADLTLDETTPTGCFLVNTVIDSRYGSERHKEVVQGLVESRLEAIRTRLLKAVAAGDVPADAEIDRLAIFLDGQFSAIAILGRSGISEPDMKAFIDTCLGVIPTCNAVLPEETRAQAKPILRQ
ncbi:TetR/AcrR family transcriptional regulator [Roseibium sp.]|uniref:TetR/AcrR family transcriptional regulator n=1 Tax=Roseibium sp. TaxID=1936156 RepID=UPI0032677B0C